MMSPEQALALRRRKLAGTLLLVALLSVYAVLAVAAAALLQRVENPWLEAAYYAVAGLLWVVPAGAVIRWMSRLPPARRGAE